MLEKMKEMIADQLSVDEDKITLESNFKDDLDADSLDLFELVMALEEEYGIEIPSEELESLTTVGAIIDYLKAHGKTESTWCRGIDLNENKNYRTFWN